VILLFNNLLAQAIRYVGRTVTRGKVLHKFPKILKLPVLLIRFEEREFGLGIFLGGRVVYVAVEGAGLFPIGGFATPLGAFEGRVGRIDPSPATFQMEGVSAGLARALAED
jgi:hypothetical protein